MSSSSEYFINKPLPVLTVMKWSVQSADSVFCVVCVHMQRGAMGDDEVNLFVTLSVWHVSVYGVNVCMLLSVYSNTVTFYLHWPIEITWSVIGMITCAYNDWKLHIPWCTLALTHINEWSCLGWSDHNWTALQISQTTFRGCQKQVCYADEFVSCCTLDMNNCLLTRCISSTAEQGPLFDTFPCQKSGIWDQITQDWY